MRRALFIDDDVNFIIKAQKLIPRGIEWLASAQLSQIIELIQQKAFDFIVVRKKNESLIRDVLQAAVENNKQEFKYPFHKVVLLPDTLWRNQLKQAFYSKRTMGEIRDIVLLA